MYPSWRPITTNATGERKIFERVSDGFEQVLVERHRYENFLQIIVHFNKNGSLENIYSNFL